MDNSTRIFGGLLGGYGWTRPGLVRLGWLLSSGRLEWCSRFVLGPSIIRSGKVVWDSFLSGVRYLDEIWILRSKALASLFVLVTVVTVSTLFCLGRMLLLVVLRHRVLGIHATKLVLDRNSFLAKAKL